MPLPFFRRRRPQEVESRSAPEPAPAPAPDEDPPGEVLTPEDDLEDLPPGASSELPEDLLDDRGHVSFSPGGKAVVASNKRMVPGAFAVANAKHKPLPAAGSKGAVFVPDGTEGIVRGIGAYTVMVEFPKPFGLLHISKADLHNPELPELRRRWAGA